MLSLFSGDIAKILTDALWPYLDANTTARIEFLSYDSTEERMAVLQRGWEAFEAAPLFGQGIGYTYAWDFPVSVHNMMLLMLAEMGILGGVWYLLFLASLAQYPRPFGLLACSVILVTGLFTHNHLERPAVAIVIALYAVSACQPSRNKSKGARQSAFEYVD
jgi:O-antigen ligase